MSLVVTAVAGLVNAATGGVDKDLSLVDTAGSILSSQRFVLAVFSIALLAMAPGIWRGKRWAAVAGVGLSAGVVLLASVGSRQIPAVASVLSTLMVGLGYRAFSTRSDPFSVGSVFRRFAAAELSILVYGIIGLYALDHTFLAATGLIDSVVGGVQLLFLVPASSVLPATAQGAHFIESVRLLSLLNVAGLVLALFVPLIRRPLGAQRDLATRIVEDHGSNRLAHFALWEDKSFSIAPERDGMVSYHVKGRVALALGGPIGTPDGRRGALTAFLEDCNENGWIPGLHQVGDEDRELLESAGFKLQHVGAEAIVDVESFTLEGSHWKKVRSSMSQLKRDGLAVEELQHPIDAATMAELQTVSDAWATDGGHRERTFTLGQFSPAYLETTRVFVLRGVSGRIEAFVNVVPPYQSSEGTFDLMRRRPDSVNGVMDALFITMIETFRAEGLSGMNLGMAPLAQLPDDTAVDRGLQRVRERGDQWFSFQGLEKFKEKWQPRWENRYVAYRNNAELAPVLRCIQTIGELETEAGRFKKLGPLARRLPATLTLGGFILWLMAATAIDPAFHQQVVDGFGLSWPDLFDLDIWRVFASALVQTDPGFVGGNALMVVAVMPVVEWLFGTRRTLLTFWLGNLITTIPVLFALRALGEIGDIDALDFAYSRDAGSSAGLWALAGTLITRLNGRRRQFAALAAVLAVHLVLALATAEVSNYQHLVATAVGFGLGLIVIEGSMRAWARARLRRLIPGRVGVSAAPGA